MSDIILLKELPKPTGSFKFLNGFMGVIYEVDFIMEDDDSITLTRLVPEDVDEELKQELKDFLSTLVPIQEFDPELLDNLH